MIHIHTHTHTNLTRILQGLLIESYLEVVRPFVSCWTSVCNRISDEKRNEIGGSNFYFEDKLIGYAMTIDHSNLYSL